MRHKDYHHEHPSLAVALNTRTRLFGTFNLAVALRGRSCGWGSCDRPRRTFVGYLRRPKPDRGLHFIELVVSRNAMVDQRVLFRIGDPAREIRRQQP